MFEFNKKIVVAITAFFNFNSSNVNSLECVSMHDKECKKRKKNKYQQ